MSHRVVNRRRSRFFLVENELLDIHARRMGVIPYAIYTGLVRISNNNEEDQCFPSLDYLALMFGINRKTVMKSLENLERLGYIGIDRFRDRCSWEPCERNKTPVDNRPYNRYDPKDARGTETQSNIYTILDFEEIALRDDELTPLKVIKRKQDDDLLAARRVKRQEARQAVVAESHAVRVSTAPLNVEINRPPAPPVAVQPTLFGEAPPVRPPKEKARAKPEYLPEATEAFEFYRKTFGRMPVNGGGTKVWFEEQIKEFGLGDTALGLRLVKAAVTRCRQKNWPLLSQLRGVLENQTEKEILRFDKEGHLKGPAGKLSRPPKFEDEGGGEEAPTPGEGGAAGAVKENFYDYASFKALKDQYCHGFDDDPLFWQALIDSYSQYTPSFAGWLNRRLKTAYQLHALTLTKDLPVEYLNSEPHIGDKMIKDYTWKRAKDFYKRYEWPLDLPPALPGVDVAKIYHFGEFVGRAEYDGNNYTIPAFNAAEIYSAYHAYRPTGDYPLYEYYQPPRVLTPEEIERDRRLDEQLDWLVANF
jgi:hypothetical protein